MEHLSHLVGAYSRIIHLDCLFAYLFRILSPLCFRRICLFAMSADIPLRSAARESHLPLLCCCSAFRAFLLFLFHASIILLLHTFCQLPATQTDISSTEKRPLKKQITITRLTERYQTILQSMSARRTLRHRSIRQIQVHHSRRGLSLFSPFAPQD